MKVSLLSEPQEQEAGFNATAHSCTNIRKWTCFPLSPLVSTSVPHNACCAPGESAIVPTRLGVKGVTGSGKGAFLPSLLHLFYPGDNPSSVASGLSDPVLHFWNVAGWFSPHLPPDLLMPFNLLAEETRPTKQSFLFCVSKCRLWMGKMNKFIYNKWSKQQIRWQFLLCGLRKLNSSKNQLGTELGQVFSQSDKLL